MQLIIHTDGGARGNPGPAATGYIIESDQGEILHQNGQYIGNTTNNVAEYQAVIHALEWVVEHYPNSDLNLQFFLDSNLVVQQLSRNFKIKQDHLLQLANSVWQLLTNHKTSASFKYIPRAQNSQADRQVNLALDKQLPFIRS